MARLDAAVGGHQLDQPAVSARNPNTTVGPLGEGKITVNGVPVGAKVGVTVHLDYSLKTTTASSSKFGDPPILYKPFQSTVKMTEGATMECSAPDSVRTATDVDGGFVSFDTEGGASYSNESLIVTFFPRPRIRALRQPDPNTIQWGRRSVLSLIRP